jgi:small subunit ribosomal protein S6
MPLYEFTYLIPSNLSAEEVKAFRKKVELYIEEKGGAITQNNFPVKKELAYPIKKNNTAFLVNLIFNLSPDKLKDLEKKIREEEQIIRFLLLKKETIRKKRVRKRELKKIIPTVQPKIEPAEKKVGLKEIEQKLEEILSE